MRVLNCRYAQTYCQPHNRQTPQTKGREPLHTDTKTAGERKTGAFVSASSKPPLGNRIYRRMEILCAVQARGEGRALCLRAPSPQRVKLHPEETAEQGDTDNDEAQHNANQEQGVAGDSLRDGANPADRGGEHLRNGGEQGCHGHGGPSSSAFHFRSPFFS